MADERDLAAVRRSVAAQDAERGGPLPAGPLHAVGAGGDGAPLAGGAAAGRRAALPGDQQAGARLDDDGDARGALAATRRGRLPAAARPAAPPGPDPLTIALPAKGRLARPPASPPPHPGLRPEGPLQR